MPAAQARATASPVMAVTQAAIAVVAAVPTVTEATADPMTTRIAMVTAISVITAGTAASAVRAAVAAGSLTPDERERTGLPAAAGRRWPASRTQGSE